MPTRLAFLIFFVVLMLPARADGQRARDSTSSVVTRAEMEAFLLRAEVIGDAGPHSDAARSWRVSRSRIFPARQKGSAIAATARTSTIVVSTVRTSLRDVARACPLFSSAMDEGASPEAAAGISMDAT